MAFSSLRSQLLCWLLAPLSLIAVADAWLTYRSAQQTATIIQERMLIGAARMIGGQVHLEEGVLQVVVPPSALELFASPSRDRVFYRVSTRQGQLLSGYFDLAPPPRNLAPEDVVYFDAVHRDKAVRIVAFAQPVFVAPERGPILVEVAQTLDGRNELAREVWLPAIWRQTALLMLVALLLWFGLRQGISPVLKLRDRMLNRAPGTLERLDPEPVPTELQPLVDAVNDYVQRLDDHMTAHDRFIADASHQLRTPLTLLNTQVVYALRTKQIHDREDTLHAIHFSVKHSIRLVHQLLAFNRVQASARSPQRYLTVDLGLAVSGVLESLALQAQQKQIDLGFEGSLQPALIFTAPHLLHEMVSNLIDNALRYTPVGGVVTAMVEVRGDEVFLTIQDTGPGIPEAQHEHVFERFVRLQENYSDGCGLGLSIVREIAKTINAEVTLGNTLQGSGLRVSVTFKSAEQPDPLPVFDATHNRSAAAFHLAAPTNSVV